MGGITDNVVAVMRSELGRNPHDRALSELVEELSVASDAFRARWAAHDVALHTTGDKHFRHPGVGELTLTFESLAISADPRLALSAYTAEPGSRSRQALSLLAEGAAFAGRR